MEVYAELVFAFNEYFDTIKRVKAEVIKVRRGGYLFTRSCILVKNGKDRDGDFLFGKHRDGVGEWGEG